MATVTAAVRSSTPSLAKMWSRWVLTVASLIRRSFPMILLLTPRAARVSTSSATPRMPDGAHALQLGHLEIHKRHRGGCVADHGLLAGFMFPREAMPLFCRALAALRPMTYSLEVVRRIALKGLELVHLWRPAVILTAFAVLLVAVSVRRFPKTME